MRYHKFKMRLRNCRQRIQILRKGTCQCPSQGIPRLSCRRPNRTISWPLKLKIIAARIRNKRIHRRYIGELRTLKHLKSPLFLEASRLLSFFDLLCYKQSMHEHTNKQMEAAKSAGRKSPGISGLNAHGRGRPRRQRIESEPFGW